MRCCFMTLKIAFNIISISPHTSSQSDYEISCFFTSSSSSEHVQFGWKFWEFQVENSAALCQVNVRVNLRWMKRISKRLIIKIHKYLYSSLLTPHPQKLEISFKHRYTPIWCGLQLKKSATCENRGGKLKTK